MAKKSAPIGGMVRNNQTMNAINDMSEPVTGVTAGDVVNQPRPIGSNFEFQARGGIQNTINQKVSIFQKQMAYKEQQKQFEKFIAQKEQGAMALYQEALGQDPELKQWIPHPDLFYDEGTGAFMPLKYAEAFAKGYKEYKKDKTTAAGQELQGKKLDQSSGYQNAALDQRAQGLELQKQGLGLQERGVQATEANTLVSAANSKEAARKNLQQESALREKTLRDDIAKNTKDLRSAMKASADASEIGDEEAKKEAESTISNSRNIIARAKKELVTHLSEQKGVKYDPETIEMSIKLQDASAPNEATPVELQQYITEVMQSEDYKPNPNTPDKEGNPSSVAQQVSDLAKEIHIFAWSKGLKDSGLLKKIDEAINQGEAIEDIIQSIIQKTGKK